MTRNKEVAVVQRANTLPMTRPHRQENVISPLADIYETPDAFVVMLDMPGVTRESIAVSMERDSLTVKGVAGPYHGTEAALLFNELRATTYVRRFNIGEGIDRNSVDAQFEHGVLTMKLFKNDAAKPREIRIK